MKYLDLCLAAGWFYKECWTCCLWWWDYCYFWGCSKGRIEYLRNLDRLTNISTSCPLRCREVCLIHLVLGVSCCFRGILKFEGCFRFVLAWSSLSFLFYYKRWLFLYCSLTDAPCRYRKQAYHTNWEDTQYFHQFYQ